MQLAREQQARQRLLEYRFRNSPQQLAQTQHHRIYHGDFLPTAQKAPGNDPIDTSEKDNAGAKEEQPQPLLLKLIICIYAKRNYQLQRESKNVRL